MNFREAMDKLDLSAPQAAEALGVSEQRVRQMRLEPGSAGHRPAAEGWQLALAKLALKRGKEMTRIGQQLLREAKRPSAR